MQCPLYASCFPKVDDQGGFEAWVKLMEDVFAEYDGWPLPCDKPVKTSLASVMAKATTLRGNGILDLVPEVRRVNGTKQLILKVKTVKFDFESWKEATEYCSIQNLVEFEKKSYVGRQKHCNAN